MVSICIKVELALQNLHCLYLIINQHPYIENRSYDRLAEIEPSSYLISSTSNSTMAGHSTTENTTTEDSSEIQIQDLKNTFGNQCKVIQDIGDFTYVATVKFNDTDLTAKFQIQDDYPMKRAHIVIQSNNMTDDERTELQLHTENCENLSLVGTVKAITDWIRDHDINLKTEPTAKNRSTRKPKKTKKIAIHDELSDAKAPPMRTAEHVIHRILWDENLPSENFVIGYIDRFLGIVEKPFISFSWEDLASVDYDVLAIPKHRIQHFKYKNFTIWEKTTRCDHVFGSTGSELDIFEIIRQEDSKEEEKRTNTTQINYSDSEDSDDEIDINTGCSARFEDDENVMSEEGHLYPREKYWGAKIRPTHFLALRITDADIKAKVRKVHDAILDLEPEYANSVIPTERLHVTLACLGLDTDEDVQRAVYLLQKLKGELQAKNDPMISVHFKNLDHFFNNTLYASVETNEALMAFVNDIKLVFTESGVSLRDIFDFVPHMTIMKLSMKFGREMNTRYLDPRLSHVFGQTDFGSQLLNNIHLCSMLEEKDVDGFYQCPTHIEFE